MRTDLHILKGDLPVVSDGRILGHEGIGVVEQVGTGISEFHVGDKVIISCVSACLKCDCKRGMYSHCRRGGWILGYTIEATGGRQNVRRNHSDQQRGWTRRPARYGTGGGGGVDVSIEAVGLPATFDICQALSRPADA
jgi:threonine dehydrogenase-like Zn-dependent dehydrogenase